MAFRNKLKGNWNMEKKISTHGPCFCFLGIYLCNFVFYFLFFSECKIKHENFVTFKDFLAHFLR
jgi:hypothetical protein